MKKNKLRESNENENTTCQNLEYNESNPKRELHSSKCLHKKPEKSQISQLFTLEPGQRTTHQITIQ